MGAEKYRHALKHLTDSQIREVMRRYYDGETVGPILDEYKIKLLPTELFKAFPLIKYDDTLCLWCKAPLFMYQPSRGGNPLPAFCQECGHNGQVNCPCHRCKIDRKQAMQLEEQQRQVEAERQKQLRQLEAERQKQFKQIKEQQQKQEIINSYSNNRKNPAPLNSLTFRQRVLLGAFLRGSSSEDPNFIAPIERAPEIITPSSDYTEEALKELLWTAWAIVIHPSSSFSSFVFPDDGSSWRYYPFKVVYELNIEPCSMEAINYLLFPPPLTASDIPAAKELWLEIARQEVLQYLNHQVKKYRLQFKPGPKTIATIDYILDRYSVSQAYNFVWTAVKNSAAAVQSGEYTNAHASNFIPGNMMSRAESSFVNNRFVKSFGREFDCPQSVLSKFFFNAVIRVGEAGFNQTYTSWQPVITSNPIPAPVPAPAAYSILRIEDNEEGGVGMPDGEEDSDLSVSTDGLDNDDNDTEESDIVIGSSADSLKQGQLLQEAVLRLLRQEVADNHRRLHSAERAEKALVSRVVTGLKKLRNQGLVAGKIRQRHIARMIQEAARTIKAELQRK